MAAKITCDVLEGYLNCRYKGHLKLAGERGMRSDYEALLAERRAEVRLRAIDKILARHGEDQVARNVPLTAAALKRGPAFVLDVALEDEAVSLHVDGLKRVEGASKLGDFHYVPVLFHEAEQVRKEQRLLLEVYALLLSRVQGRTPGCGVVWHGRACRATKVRLGTDPRKAEQVLRDLQEMRGAGPPRLVLNDHCQVCEFRQRCHDQAVREDNLSLLRGLGEKEVRSYARKGILTLAQLAHTFRPRRKGRRAVRKTHHRYHALQALAVRDKRVYVFGTPELPDSPVKVYLDIEGKPDEGFVYLIGMLAVRQDGSEERLSFWADTREQERDIFDRFLAEAGRYEDFRVFCYGGYERAFLKRMRAGAERKDAVDRVLDRLVNVLSLVYAHVYFPCHSNGLKDVARCLGCSWTEPDASGLQSLLWRARWEATHEDGWKRKLLAYNQEDCAALGRVAGFLYALRDRAGAAATPGTTREASPDVAWMEDLKPHPTRRTWCRATFLIPAFAEINDCAYFDYQREKVYVRTSPTLARAARRRARKKQARKYRANRRVELTAEECPHCGSKEILPRDGRVRRRQLYDLKFSAGGITRRVIECVARPSSCGGCGKAVFPDQLYRLAKHQHALRSWVVHEHMAHRVGFEKIRAALDQYFGVQVCNVHLLKLKDLMARYYRETYDGLLRRIVSGDLVHADETAIRLKAGDGYVWVFTNLEEVVYLFKPTREGGFLHDLLKGFTGVLVSDFFSAYDSLPCPQQKCLIHLIRDFNNDLFHSPYDDELKLVASQFGELLRPIIRTVDRRGLRSKHLSRHKGAVSRFFGSLAGAHYASEVAQGYQARLLKNRDKLFTFLDHDGVPWNNNNAEHAVKQFAYYRRTCEGHITAAGLQEYLVLLSIAQTCKFKGVSFLKFLLSRELDIDQFCAGGKSHDPQPPDVYPKGFCFRRFGDRKLPGDEGGG
jgi:predicted RecB family nuclease